MRLRGFRLPRIRSIPTLKAPTDARSCNRLLIYRGFESSFQFETAAIVMIGGIDPDALLIIALALGIGGFVKGATGAGTPLVAVPIIAAFYDVTMGILVMVVPNIIMNARQVWAYRANIRPAQIAILMSVASVPGMLVGTRMLSTVSQDALLTGLGLFLVAYLA